MAKLLYPDFFNNVFGPIMQPGLSGSFAGTSRVGRIARHLLGERPVCAEINWNLSDDRMHSLGNRMDDRGYLGGILDFAPDDERLFSAHEFARAERISYRVEKSPAHNVHPGSVRIELVGQSGATATLIARSVNDGMVTTCEMQGFPVVWRGDTHAVLATGDAMALSRLAHAYQGEALVQERLVRADGAEALFMELSDVPVRQILRVVSGERTDIRVLPALLPVVSTRARKPQLFRTVGEWRAVAQKMNVSFAQAAIEYEKAFSGWDDERIRAYLGTIADLMEKQIHSLERLGYDNVPDTPTLGAWNGYRANAVSDGLTRHILTHAFSVNAEIPGVKIVPGPMGMGGYLFSALDAVREKIGASREKGIEALAVAAGLGVIAYTHTNASGEVGCVGESVYCAMASGAVAWLAGGDGVQVERAASMALQANIGIFCDPIPGGLQFPCITRTLRAAVTAPLFADLALAGFDPMTPYHEVLGAMDKNDRETTGKALCGSGGGMTCTPAACARTAFLQNEVMERRLISEAEDIHERL